MNISLNKDCDLCNAAFDQSRLIAIENEFPIVKCNNCGFIYVNKQPKAEEGKVIGEYYIGDEVENQYKDYAKVNDFLLCGKIFRCWLRLWLPTYAYGREWVEGFWL
jgi:uncharacterized Zn finger protein